MTCCSNMSWQHVTKNQIRQNLCNLLRRQILLQRQRFFYKNSPVHMKPFVAEMFCSNVLLQLVAQPAHTELSVDITCCCKLSSDLHTQSDLLPRETCCCNLFPDLYTRSDLSPRLVAVTCRPTCTHRVFCCRDLLLQLVTLCVLNFTGQNYVQVKIL